MAVLSAHFVVPHRHGAVVADEEVLIAFESYRRAIPVAWVLHVRLVEQLAVDENLAAKERHRLTRQPDDAFHVHHAAARQPDGHNVPALRPVTEVGEAVDEVDPAGAVVGHHAGALHADGPQDERGDRKHHHDQHEYADESVFGPAPNQQNLPPLGLAGWSVLDCHVSDAHFKTLACGKLRVVGAWRKCG